MQNSKLTISLIKSFLDPISENNLHLHNPTLQLSGEKPMLFLLSHDESDHRLYSASIAFKNCDDLDLETLDNSKFEIFQILENLAYTALSEKHNDDACSFTYHFDTDNAGSNPIITVSITDYLS